MRLNSECHELAIWQALYFGVDVEQVWLTASIDIPTLKIEIEEVVNN